MLRRITSIEKDLILMLKIDICTSIYEHTVLMTICLCLDRPDKDVKLKQIYRK